MTADAGTGKVKAADVEPDKVKTSSDTETAGKADSASKTEKDTAKEEKKEKSKEYLEAMKKGAEAEASGDLGMALWHFWQAADMEDEDPEPYLALTRIHMKRKEKGSALKAYQKAIKNGAARNPEVEEYFSPKNEEDSDKEGSDKEGTDKKSNSEGK